MKKLLTPLSKISLYTVWAIACCYCQAGAQTWGPVGTPDFSAGVAASLSMVINSSGTPFVAYQDSSTAQAGATVMSYGGGSWVPVGSIEFSAGSAAGVNMAIDGSGNLYVVYADGANGNKVTVMGYNGAAWMPVGSPGFSAGAAAYTSIAIDPSGTPYVAFEDLSASAAGVTVMEYNGSSWVTLGSPSFSAAAAHSTSIAINAGGTPYVAYEDYNIIPSAPPGGATVMQYNGSSWVTVGSAIFSAGGISSPSMAIDGSGNVYVAYQDLTTSSLGVTVMEYTGSSWVTLGSAGFSAGAALYPSIAVGWGTPYVAFQDATAGYGATVMAYSSSGWATVGSAGFSPGSASSLTAVTYYGQPYLGIVDLASGSHTTVFGTTTIAPTGVCGIEYWYDATGNRIYRTDTCTTILSSDRVAGNDSASTTNTDNTKTIPANSNSSITANIFPNPSQGSINITISQPITDATVTLLDVNGGLIKQMNMSGVFTSLDLSNYASGTYMITVKNTMVNFIFKIQKM